MNKQKHSPMGVGVLTILTILLVLMLAIFSALTFASARADLSLSQINGDTVSAYYKADSKATAMAHEFALGLDEQLEARIPVTDMQDLHIRLQRTTGQEFEILAWNIVSSETAAEVDDQPLNVWDGSVPGES